MVPSIMEKTGLSREDAYLIFVHNVQGNLAVNRLLGWKQNMFSSVISRSSTRGCIFEATTLYCGIKYISVVEPTGETNA